MGGAEFSEIKRGRVPLPAERISQVLEFDCDLAALAAARESDGRFVLVNSDVVPRRGPGRLALLARLAGPQRDFTHRPSSVAVVGLERVRLLAFRTREPFPLADVAPFAEPPLTPAEQQEVRQLRRRIRKMAIAPTRRHMAGRIDTRMVDRLCVGLGCGSDIRLQVLTGRSIRARLDALLGHPDMSATATREDDDASDLGARFRKAVLPDAVHRVVQRELSHVGERDRLAVQFLLDIRWQPEPVGSLNLADAQLLLDRSHAGMHDVKEALLDYLAALEWGRLHGTAAANGQNLCLLGPPGTGKTSIAETVAKVLDRKLVRIALAGVDDLYVIGSDRGYTRARPGVIVRALREAGRHPNGLVYLLDEIDKVANYVTRSAVPALLALLDPEQNHAWRDHYFDEVFFDLSGALFVATANDEASISAPLRDRLRVIRVPAYSAEEQVEIGCRFLLPRLKRQMGLRGEVYVPRRTVRALVLDHPGSPGMRRLRQRLQLVLTRGVRRHLLTGERVIVDLELARVWIPPSVRPVTRTAKRMWPIWVDQPPVRC